MRLRPGIAAVAALLSASPALAAEQTVKLSVSNMSCVTCVPVVKSSLGSVPGVTKVIVSADTGVATVTFDDRKATVDALINAVTKAGYPAKLAAPAAGKSS